MINIIFGPPGTGKTFTLLDEVDKCIKDGVEIDKIGFFTFSKNATREVHKRMYNNFGYQQKELKYFRTLHSLGFKQLNYSTEKVMSNENYKEIGKVCGIEMTYATWDDDNGGMFSSDSPYLSLIELARAKGLTPVEQYNLGEHKDDLDKTTLMRVDREIKNFKRDRPGMVDFTDMVSEFARSNVCPKLKVAFIDEAQDLSVMQWKVVEKIRDNCDILFVAGDDDQCIYKWRGASVTCFLNLKGNRTVLDKSYRIPKKIFNFANKIINRIPNKRRVEKKWTPTSEEGLVCSHFGIEDIDLSQGEWLILGADRWKLDAYENYLKENNIYHERAKKDNPIKDKYEAIDLYENKLKKGEALTYDECHSIKKKMLKEQWDNKMFKALVRDKMYSLSDLKQKYGLNTEDSWQGAFTRMGQADTEKITDLLKRGEDLKNGARIKLATIHGVKGNESDNVVLPLSLTKTAQEAYETNPDDTHRLMYVGSTRSKKTLHVIYPESKGGYEI